MRLRSSRVSALLACAASASGFVLSGCGGSSVASAIDPVAKAAEVSELAPGFKASIFEEHTPPGSSETATGAGTGIFDQRDHRGVLTMKITAEEHSATVEAQYSHLAMYMHFSSSHSSALTHGRPWVKFDLGRIGEALGLSFSALPGAATSSDPRSLLSYLRATAGGVARINTEQVTGVPTTHYRATIDFDRYASRVPPAQRTAAQQSVAALERLTGTHHQLVDVWVDQRQRVRRMEQTFQECLPGVAGATRIRLKVEFYDFGIQAMPPLPPDSQVADVTSAVAEKLKHIKLGCS